MPDQSRAGCFARLRWWLPVALVWLTGCAPYDPDLFAWRALTLGRRLLVQALGFALFG